MLAEGELAVGLLILVCSVLVPLLKLGGMLLLCWRDPSRIMGSHARARMFRLIDWIGRWGMVDVLLVAILVAAVKLGNWVDVHPGPGVVAFAGVVVLSLLASAAFDPHAIWEDQQ
jgi:paraquat-inducible protein A